MTLKNIILTICCSFGIFETWGQTETIVNFRKSDQVLQTKGFRFTLIAHNDTLKTFNYTDSKDYKQDKVLMPIDKDAVIGVFEYTVDFKTWQKEEYPITIDKDLKRIEIDLYFSTNDKKAEFLQDYTVDKFFHTGNVLIQSAFKREVGAQPVFILISNSDTIFWGGEESKILF